MSISKTVRKTVWFVILGALTLAAACGGSTSTTSEQIPTPSVAVSPTTVAASTQAPAATDTFPTTGATTPSAPVTEPTTAEPTTTATPVAETPLGGRTACDLMTAAEVAAVIGGEITDGPRDSTFQCSFVLVGDTKLGSIPPNSSYTLSISGDWPGSMAQSPAEVLGVAQDGLGDEAYLFTDRLGQLIVTFRVGAIEAKVTTQVVNGASQETANAAALALAHAVVAKLG